jgi:hypothetical protein
LGSAAKQQRHILLVTRIGPGVVDPAPLAHRLKDPRRRCAFVRTGRDVALFGRRRGGGGAEWRHRV